MRSSVFIVASATLMSGLAIASGRSTASSLPACEYLKDFNAYPSDGISQLVFKTDGNTDTVTAVDRPDQPELASYKLTMDEASGDKASFILSVIEKQSEAHTIFRTIFYTSQGYPDIYAHKVKNDKPCSVTILKPANTDGSLAMNVIAFAA